MGSVPATRAPSTVPLAGPAPPPAQRGGKAASLIRLAAADLPVPDGFVITTGAYHDYLNTHALTYEIERPLDDPDRTARLFDEHPLPDHLMEDILEVYAELGEPPVAVRSS